MVWTFISMCVQVHRTNPWDNELVELPFMASWAGSIALVCHYCHIYLLSKVQRKSLKLQNLYIQLNNIPLTMQHLLLFVCSIDSRLMTDWFGKYFKGISLLFWLCSFYCWMEERWHRERHHTTCKCPINIMWEMTHHNFFSLFIVSLHNSSGPSATLHATNT